MSDNVTIAAISSIITGIFLLANTIITLTVKNRLENYRKEVNGMKKELVEAVRGKGEAEGNLKGRLEQTEENKSK